MFQTVCLRMMDRVEEAGVQHSSLSMNILNCSLQMVGGIGPAVRGWVLLLGKIVAPFEH